MGQTSSRLNGETIVLKAEKLTKAFGKIGLCETKGTRRQLIACQAKYSTKEPQFYLGNTTQTIHMRKAPLQFSEEINLNIQRILTPIVYDAHFKEFLGLDAQGVTFYFEHLDVSLEDIILSRKVRNSIFPEQEIINVGLAVLSTLLFLKQYDIEGGNIEPSTIFYDKGQIKVYLNQLIQGRLAPYNMILDYNSRNPLPSPEVLYASKNRRVDLVEKYRYESDIFTLGLSLLEMATLEKSSELFNVEIRQVNVKKLDQRYTLLKQRYSDKLNNLIKQMLTMDPTKRPSCESLINQIRSGIITAPVTTIPSGNFGVRSYSLTRSSSGQLNQSFLNASQISGIKTSGVFTTPVLIGNSRLASADRRGSLTGTNVLVTPTGSRIIQGVQAHTVPTEHVTTQVQQVETENGEARHYQTEQIPESIPQQQQVESKENSIKSVPLSQQPQKVQAVQRKSITSRPQIVTSNVPQNYIVNSRIPPQTYQTPQTVRYVPAPPFQNGGIHKNIISSPQQYYSIQQHKQQQQQIAAPPQHPIQSPSLPINSPQGYPPKFVNQKIQYANSSTNLHQFPPQQLPHSVRHVVAQPQIIPGRQHFGGGVVQYPQVPVGVAYPHQANPQGYLTLQQQPISSPLIQKNQIQNLLQNHQSETNNRMTTLGQKVQELDERVSKSIANSFKVTQQHYNEERQDGITDEN